MKRLYGCAVVYLDGAGTVSTATFTSTYQQMDAAIGLPAKNNLLSRIYHGSCCLSADRQHTYFATNIQYFAYIDNISNYFLRFFVFL